MNDLTSISASLPISQNTTPIISLPDVEEQDLRIYLERAIETELTTEERVELSKLDSDRIKCYLRKNISSPAFIFFERAIELTKEERVELSQLDFDRIKCYLRRNISSPSFILQVEKVQAAGKEVFTLVSYNSTKDEPYPFKDPDFDEQHNEYYFKGPKPKAILAIDLLINHGFSPDIFNSPQTDHSIYLLNHIQEALLGTKATKEEIEEWSKRPSTSIPVGSYHIPLLNHLTGHNKDLFDLGMETSIEIAKVQLQTKQWDFTTLMYFCAFRRCKMAEWQQQEKHSGYGLPRYFRQETNFNYAYKELGKELKSLHYFFFHSYKAAFQKKIKAPSATQIQPPIYCYRTNSDNYNGAFYMNLNGTEITLSRLDLTGKNKRIQHTPAHNIKPLLNEAAHLYQQVLDATDLESTLFILGKMFWIICQAKPWYRGDPSITEMMIRSLLVSKGYISPPWKKDIIPWCEMSKDIDGDAFANDFVLLFDTTDEAWVRLKNKAEQRIEAEFIEFLSLKLADNNPIIILEKIVAHGKHIDRLVNLYIEARSKKGQAIFLENLDIYSFSYSESAYDFFKIMKQKLSADTFGKFIIHINRGEVRSIFLSSLLEGNEEILNCIKCKIDLKEMAEAVLCFTKLFGHKKDEILKVWKAIGGPEPSTALTEYEKILTALSKKDTSSNTTAL